MNDDERRLRGRKLATLVALLALVLTLFAVTLVKMRDVETRRHESAASSAVPPGDRGSRPPPTPSLRA